MSNNHACKSHRAYIDPLDCAVVDLSQDVLATEKGTYVLLYHELQITIRAAFVRV